jgi:hypothetical protein
MRGLIDRLVLSVVPVLIILVTFGYKWR